MTRSRLANEKSGRLVGLHSVFRVESADRAAADDDGAHSDSVVASADLSPVVPASAVEPIRSTDRSDRAEAAKRNAKRPAPLPTT